MKKFIKKYGFSILMASIIALILSVGITYLWIYRHVLDTEAPAMFCISAGVGLATLLWIAGENK